MKTQLCILAIATACISFAALGAGAPGNLRPERLAQVAKGKSTKADVRATLGEPSRTWWLPAEQREAWAYNYRGDWEFRTLWIQWAPDGTVFEISDSPDFERGRYRGH